MPITPKKIESQDLKATIKGLDGLEKEYVFNKLHGKQASKVFHEACLVVVPILFSGLDLSDNMSALAYKLKDVSFDDVWDLAENLLSFVIIDGTEIRDINKSDYFGENPDELYIAVYHAVKLNFPKIFNNLSSIQGSLFSLDGAPEEEDK